MVLKGFYQQECDSVCEEVLSGGKLSWYSRCYSEHKDVNQDSIGIFENTEKEFIVLAMADGMGGHAGGEKASQLTIETLLEALKKERRKDPIESIINSIEKAHQEIKKLGNESGTTLTVVQISEKHARFYTIGDSPAILMKADGELVYQTAEHTATGLLKVAGVNPNKIEGQSVNNYQLLNALGHDHYYIEIGQPISLRKKDIILLASDGLSDNYDIKNIFHSFSEKGTNKKLEYILQKAKVDLENSEASLEKPDDLSALLFQVN